MNLSKEIASMYDDAVRIRQDLHRIPEIGFQLHDTQAYVLNELRQCAPDRLETPAVCGVKAVFFAKDAQKTIALRADMDGNIISLTIDEVYIFQKYLESHIVTLMVGGQKMPCICME